MFRLKMIFFLLFISLSYIMPISARADIIYLKNGRIMEGLIKAETDEDIHLDLGFGITKLKKSRIKSIQRSCKLEAIIMRRQWEVQAQQKQKERQEQKKEEQIKAEKVLLDKKLKQGQGKIQKRAMVEYIAKQNRIGVAALLNNKLWVELVVDTGASTIVLTDNIAKRLGISLRRGIKVEVTLADGSIREAVTIILDKVRVGDMEVSDVRAIILAEDKSLNLWGGLLGMSFLEHFVFSIDSENKKLILERKLD